MIEPIKIVLLVFFVIDMFLTYHNVYHYKKLYPKKDYTRLELNPLPRFFWNNYGLFMGGIIATMLQFLILVILLSYLNRDSFLILIGFYLMVIITHIDTMNLIRKKITKKVTKSPKWRKYVVIGLLILSLIDLGTTTYYLNEYHKWRPEVPFNEMENNPLLLFLINVFGINLGLFFAAIIIWSLIYLVGKKAHWFVVISVFGVLIFGSIINIIHITMLHDLIKLYPLGYVP